MRCHVRVFYVRYRRHFLVVRFRGPRADPALDGRQVIAAYVTATGARAARRATWGGSLPVGGRLRVADRPDLPHQSADRPARRDGLGRRDAETQRYRA